MYENKFAFASVVCAAIALLGFATIVIPIVCGSLAVIFGVLSKGDGKMEKYAKIGTSVGGVLLAIVLTFVMVTTVRFFTDPDYRARAEKLFENTVGVSLEEYNKMFNGSEEIDAKDEDSLYDINNIFFPEF
ncbi:MAG: hypothetical protein MJ105_06380 [Lachnospiraceae bacterium]|nr:hypothetical protein [Lachnospiraceae bacterium]